VVRSCLCMSIKRRMTACVRYKAIIEAASTFATLLQAIDFNPGAKTLASSGTKMRPFRRTCWSRPSSLQKHLPGTQRHNRRGRNLFRLRDLPRDANLWFRFTEATFDNFISPEL